jgi:hypothetical protein
VVWCSNAHCRLLGPLPCEAVRSPSVVRRWRTRPPKVRGLRKNNTGRRAEAGWRPHGFAFLIASRRDGEGKPFRTRLWPAGFSPAPTAECRGNP